MNKELIQKDKEDKAIKFYTNYIENQEKELDWMYRQDEEYYRDEIEQKELLIKGFKTILNLIEKQSKEIEELQELSISARAVNQIDKLQKEIRELKEKNKQLDFLYNDACKCLLNTVSKDKIKAKIEEIDIEIQCCEYADDDTEEYKQDIEKEKRRLLRDKAVLQSLLEKE